MELSWPLRKAALAQLHVRLSLRSPDPIFLRQDQAPSPEP